VSGWCASGDGRSAASRSNRATGELSETPQASFAVLGTTSTLRAEARGEYIVCVNRRVRERLELGQWAVVEHTVGLDDGETTRTLRVIARVVTDDELADRELRTDQTCRNAVGIPFEYDPRTVRARVRPLRVGRFRASLMRLARLVGRRYVILRVHKGDIPDMEKRLARMGGGLFPVVGVPQGGRLVVESVRELPDGSLQMASVRVRALELGEDAQKRIRLAEEPRSDARFVNASACLGIDPDIGDLFLDLNERERLTATSLDPVRVRRDLGDLLEREILGAGIIFFLSLFGVSAALPWDKGWLKFAVVAAGAVVLTLTILVLNLRAQAE
jgi:hypothetical protein